MPFTCSCKKVQNDVTDLSTSICSFAVNPGNRKLDPEAIEKSINSGFLEALKTTEHEWLLRINLLLLLFKLFTVATPKHRTFYLFIYFYFLVLLNVGYVLSHFAVACTDGLNCTCSFHESIIFPFSLGFFVGSTCLHLACTYR